MVKNKDLRLTLTWRWLFSSFLWSWLEWVLWIKDMTSWQINKTFIFLFLVEETNKSHSHCNFIGFRRRVNLPVKQPPQFHSSRVEKYYFCFFFYSRSAKQKKTFRLRKFSLTIPKIHDVIVLWHTIYLITKIFLLFNFSMDSWMVYVQNCSLHTRSFCSCFSL